MTKTIRPLPVYTTRGDVGAFLVYPHLYNPIGEWIGFVTAERDVFSVLGIFVGILTDPFRIIRRRSDDQNHPRINPSATVPLAPLLPELGFETIDVLYETPELLHPVDSGDMREDM